MSELDTLADWQAQAAVATGSVTQDTVGNHRRCCRGLRSTERSVKHMPAGGLPSTGQVKESSHSIESSVQAAGTTLGEESITWLSRSMEKRSGADSRTMPTTCPSPRIQHCAKEIPLIPTQRRPLQCRCRHFADPSPCQKQAPHCVWVASTIVAPSGVCLPRVKAPRCMGEQMDSPSATVFVARQLIQRFIDESIDTLLEGSDRGVQERHVQLNSQHEEQAHEVASGVYCRNVRRSATRDSGDSAGRREGDERGLPRIASLIRKAVLRRAKQT